MQVQSLAPTTECLLDAQNRFKGKALVWKTIREKCGEFFKNRCVAWFGCPHWFFHMMWKMWKTRFFDQLSSFFDEWFLENREG